MLFSVIYFWFFISKIFRLKNNITTSVLKKIFSFLLIFFIIISSFSTLSTSFAFSQNASDTMYDFKIASTSLSKNMQKTDLAIVPYSVVFDSYEPSLYGHFIDSSTIWTKAGVYFGGDTTAQDILRVRSFLFNFLKEMPTVKYIVIDKIYPQTYLLFNSSIYDELNSVLIKEIEFPQKSGYTDPISVYRVVSPQF